MIEKKVLKFNGSIKEMDVDKLIPYEFNNKIHNEKQVDLLANIIGKFGYVDEIVVDKNNIIIAGHGRLESIKKMGYEAVEVKVMDIDSRNASELRLLHNKISEYETENNLENIQIELKALGYEDKLENLEVSLQELYPDFDAPEYNPDDYEEDDLTPMDNGSYKVIVNVGSKDNCDLLTQELETLGYSDYKIV